jgi:2,3-bisphosphoglycerate-independent phosphoglycerate mutase
MLDNDGNIVTSHSMSPVPFYLVSQRYKDQKLFADGKLANIAPTVLKLLDLPIPASMDKPLF